MQGLRPQRDCPSYVLVGRFRERQPHRRARCEEALTPCCSSPAGLDAPAPIYDLHRQLIGVRRRNAWINDATVAEPDVVRNEVIAYRVTDASHTLAVVLNTGDETAELRLPTADGRVAAGDGTAAAGGDGGLDVTVAAHSYLIVT